MLKLGFYIVRSRCNVRKLHMTRQIKWPIEHTIEIYLHTEPFIHLHNFSADYLKPSDATSLSLCFLSLSTEMNGLRN